MYIHKLCMMSWGMVYDTVLPTFHRKSFHVFTRQMPRVPCCDGRNGLLPSSCRLKRTVPRGFSG